MMKLVLQFICLCTLLVSINVTESFGQSTFSQVYSILNSVSCGSGNNNCHSATGLSSLNFGTTEQALYNQLYYQSPSNSEAAAKGDMLVLPGNPYRSFLFRKVNQGLAVDAPLTGNEGDNMPTTSSLTENERELIRQWIIYGAPQTGNVVDMSLVNDYYDNGGIESVANPPSPPVPGEGFQLHLGPIFLPPLGESPEGGDYSRFDMNFLDTLEAIRIETYAGIGVHHTTLFVYNDVNGIPDVPYGATELVPELMGMEILATYQFVPDFLDLPEGTAYELPQNSPLIFNSHYFNTSQSQVRKCDTYFNVYTQPENTAAQTLKFGAHEYVSFPGSGNPALYLPPDGQEYSFEEFIHEPGNTEYRYIWAIIGHVHEHCTDYDIYRRNPDGSIGDQLSDVSCIEAIPGCTFPSFDPWHIPTRYFEAFEPVRMDYGFYHHGSYVNNTNEPITWGPSAFGQEMMVFGYYYVTDTTGVTIADITVNTSEEVDDESFSVYPNPFNNEISINISANLRTENGTIEVYSSLGMVVYSNHLNTFSGIIKNTDLTGSGVYLMRLSFGDKQVITKRIICLN